MIIVTVDVRDMATFARELNAHVKLLSLTLGGIVAGMLLVAATLALLDGVKREAFEAFRSWWLSIGSFCLAFGFVFWACRLRTAQRQGDLRRARLKENTVLDGMSETDLTRLDGVLVALLTSTRRQEDEAIIQTERLNLLCCTVILALAFYITR